jgi:hypothetical protein
MPGFLLTDEELASYNPAAFFTATQMVDTVPRLDRVFSEGALELLAEGIPVTQLPATLGPWPTNLTNVYSMTRSDAMISATGATGPRAAGAASSASGVPIIPPPPGP